MARNFGLRSVQRDNTSPSLQWFLAILAMLAIGIAGAIVMFILGMR